MLTSFDDLRIIPIDILEQGSRKIVQYMMDLFSSPEADPLYRSKLMVVGFENVGKTTILDCLFPLEGWLHTQGKLKKTPYWCRLQGNVFAKYNSPTDLTAHKDRYVYLESRQWEVTSLFPRNLAIRLIPRKVTEQNPELELHFPNKRAHDAWLVRLKRLCMNEATHGIEINSVKVENSATKEYFNSIANGDTEKSQHRQLQLSVWDFAGQHDYYNNHHHFISTRTVFLVLWKLSDGDEKGMKGIEFWLRSLASHLVSPESASTAGVYFSIFVVGTFLDHPSVKREDKNNRSHMVDNLAKTCGLDSIPLQYFEVSCGETQENIGILQEAITKTSLAHSYIGERVPMKYLSISDYLIKAQENPSSQAPQRGDTISEREGSKDSPSYFIPIMNIKELVDQFGEESMVKRALSLLSLWGECIYFDSPPELSSLVIMDPKFLVKGILADLFTSNETSRGLKRTGIVQHSHLVHLWTRYKSKTMSQDEFSTLCKTFLTLLEKMDVCFVIEEDKKTKDFLAQRTVIPALLRDTSLAALDGKRFVAVWPKDPPHNRPIQIERILKFSVIPSELVSRLLVHLHEFIQESLITKHEILLLMPKADNTQTLIRADQELNRFYVTIRGSELKQCIKILDFVMQQVYEVAQKYKAVTCVGAIRSPHSTASEIDIASISLDAGRPLDKRELQCPTAKLPIKAERLLFRAGLIEKVPQPNGM